MSRGLRFERHQEIGRRLAEINDELADLGGELDSTYPHARVLKSRLGEVLRGLASLRDEMEERLWDDHPTRASESIYHPPSRRDRR